MSTDARDPPVVRLNELNYAIWSSRMKAIFATREPSLLFTISSDFVASEATAPKAALDIKALYLLSLYVSDPLVQVVLDCPTTLAAWTQLESTYRSALPSRHLQLRKELFALRLQPTESLTTYFARARAICTELTTSGCTIGIPEVVMAVLAGLPPAYTTIVSILEAGEVLTLELLLPKLLPHEVRIKADESIDAVALYTNSKGSGYRSTPTSHTLPRSSTSHSSNYTLPSHPGATCTYCAKKGHVMEVCNTRKAAEALQASILNPRANAFYGIAL